MAGPATVLDQPFHVRSTSMPSRPQPLGLRVEEELKQLRTVVASTSSTTPQMMCNRLRELGNLYDCVEEILHLPSNQQVLGHTHQKKWVEKELDQSIKLLDLCAVMRDNLVAIKDCSQDLSLALRRKDAFTEGKLEAYSRSGKKAKKEIKKCLRLLKHTSKSRSISTLDKDCDVSMVINMLIEAREITTSLLEAVFFSVKPRGESKNSRWSFVAKALHQRKVACEDELEYINEAEILEHLETGLNCLVRRLILNRVSLLNIISL